MDFQKQLPGFFNALCDAAAKETLPIFRTPVDVSNKLDAGFDPVTIADRNAEKVIRALIEETFPDHGIVGEEFGISNGDAEYQWVIDPIDGTRAFISGLPVWGTLIGLYQSGKPIAGVMDQPFTRERYMTVGNGSTLSIGGGEETSIKTSGVTSLSGATLMTTTPQILQSYEDKAYFEVESRVKLVRYGCDCYAYAMLASAQVELVIESGLNIYDIAALIPIIENAGGVVTDWQGGNAAQGGQVLAAANEQIHKQAMDILSA